MSDNQRSEAIRNITNWLDFDRKNRGAPFTEDSDRLAISYQEAPLTYGDLRAIVAVERDRVIGQAMNDAEPGEIVFVDLTKGGTKEVLEDDQAQLMKLIDSTAQAKFEADEARAQGKAVPAQEMSRLAVAQRTGEQAVLDLVSKMIDRRSRELADRKADETPICTWQGGKLSCSDCDLMATKDCKQLQSIRSSTQD